VNGATGVPALAPADWGGSAGRFEEAFRRETEARAAMPGLLVGIRADGPQGAEQNERGPSPRGEGDQVSFL